MNCKILEVETLESSEWSAPGRAEEGTWLSGERRHGTGEAKTASPRPLLTATPTFLVPRAAGEGPARHWEGAFRSVEGKDGAVAVRRRHGQAVRGTRRHPSGFADSQKGVPTKPRSAARVEAPQGRAHDVARCEHVMRAL